MKATTLLGLTIAALVSGPLCVGPRRVHAAPAAVSGPPVLFPAQAARIARTYVLKIYDAGSSTAARIGLDPGKLSDFGLPTPAGFAPVPASTHGTGLRCFAYCFPQGLVNWDSPQVTFLGAMNTTKYRGPGWQVHFIAPRQPGAPPHLIKLPGDDFNVLLARDGRVLYTTQGMD